MYHMPIRYPPKSVGFFFLQFGQLTFVSSALGTHAFRSSVFINWLAAGEEAWQHVYSVRAQQPVGRERTVFLKYTRRKIHL